ncbi:mitochondrial 37S ribosomal protein mS38 QRI5 RNJ42_02718 [Nakaseomyces bracarensis]|uniref:mitochondrial 37S ribosomal protein mS38 QRI5 n=1 Tax=Nakaseomyces bracarensis TaxID=273131 RepID=UPI0038726A2A
MKVLAMPLARPLATPMVMPMVVPMVRPMVVPMVRPLVRPLMRPLVKVKVPLGPRFCSTSMWSESNAVDAIIMKPMSRPLMGTMQSYAMDAPVTPVNALVDPVVEEGMFADSVMRKRRKKMKKHKLRKRRRKEKAERRKLSQGR